MCKKSLTLTVCALFVVGSFSIALAKPPGPKPGPKKPGPGRFGPAKAGPGPKAKVGPKVGPKVKAGPVKKVGRVKVGLKVVAPIVKHRVVRAARPVVVRRGAAVVISQPATRVVNPPNTVVVNSPRPVVELAVADSQREKPHKILRVLDPATVVITLNDKPTKVRLTGVQLATTGADDDTTVADGTKYLQEMIEGKFVFLDFDDSVASHDEEGAAMAYVYRAKDQYFANRDLVRQGFAITADYEFKHGETFAKSQQAAEGEKIGVWSGE